MTFLDSAVSNLTVACVKAKGAIDDRNDARIALLTAAVFFKRPDLFIVDGPDGLPVAGLFFQHLKKVTGISLKPTRNEIRVCENVRRIMEAEAEADAGKVRNPKAGRA